MSDETTTTSNERVGFCQDCGKPLTKETVRTVGSGVFCEPCLEVRLAGASSATQSAAPNAGYAQTIPPVGMPAKLPNPVLAGLLSIIPGVGQVYNGQYAKGIAILLLCAVLDSIGKANHFGFFGVAAFGLWIYQIVDAYQTAKARVEGRPLPNPFELNDIGERLGFGKGFGTSADMRAAAYGTAPVAPPPSATQAPPSPTATWAGYVPPAPPNAPYTTPAPPPPYGSVPPAMPIPPMPPMPTSGSSFPLVAIWLIGLGALFTLMELIPDMRINGSVVTAIVLGAVAATVIVRRLGYMGGIHYPDSVLHMMRGPVIFATLAVLFLLQGVHALTLGQTWPVILVALGAVLLGERLGVGSHLHGNDFVTPPTHDAAPPSVVPPAANSTEENEGRDGYSR